MKGIVYLSGEDPVLAEQEVLGAIRSLGGKHGIDLSVGPVRVLSAPPPGGLASRMGFCHFDGTVQVETGPSIDDIVEGAVSVVMEEPPASLGLIARSTGGLEPRMIFDALDKAARDRGIKLHHRHPSRKLFAVGGRERSYIGWVGSECDRRSILGRRGSRMPFSRPIVMDPRLARAMVNLSGLPPGSRILDPFMGPGGLVIEASHLGMRCTGIEIDPVILSGARRNIEMLGGPGPARTILGDSRELPSVDIGPDRSFEGIVTDPPFGRSASLKGSTRDGLVPLVLEAASSMLDHGSPVVMDLSDPASIGDIVDYSVITMVPHRVHKSLTRHVTVLRKR